jgi:hypothetical protein
MFHVRILYLSICQAAGLCEESDFFYSPTTFNLQEQEFVFDTVQRFYTEDAGIQCPGKVSDDILILFAASCLLMHGLTTTNWAKHGYSYFPLDKANVSYYMNSTCFTIIHACNMRAGAAFAASQLLRKHGVSIEI